VPRVLELPLLESWVPVLLPAVPRVELEVPLPAVLPPVPRVELVWAWIRGLPAIRAAASMERPTFLILIPFSFSLS